MFCIVLISSAFWTVNMNIEQSLKFMIFHETRATDWSMLWFLTLRFSSMQVFPIESLYFGAIYRYVDV